MSNLEVIRQLNEIADLLEPPLEQVADLAVPAVEVVQVVTQFAFAERSGETGQLKNSFKSV